MSKSVQPMFYSRNSTVSGLTLKYFIYFLAYFCIQCKQVVQCDSLTCSCPVFPRPYIEDVVFFSLIFLPHLSYINHA